MITIDILEYLDVTSVFYTNSCLEQCSWKVRACTWDRKAAGCCTWHGIKLSTPQGFLPRLFIYCPFCSQLRACGPSHRMKGTLLSAQTDLCYPFSQANSNGLLLTVAIKNLLGTEQSGLTPQATLLHPLLWSCWGEPRCTHHHCSTPSRTRKLFL